MIKPATTVTPAVFDWLAKEFQEAMDLLEYYLEEDVECETDRAAFDFLRRHNRIAQGEIFYADVTALTVEERLAAVQRTQGIWPNIPFDDDNK